MKDLSPKDLKSILHSKRANMFYLEYCRVMQKDGRVLYLTESASHNHQENQYFNIPIVHTTAKLYRPTEYLHGWMIKRSKQHLILFILGPKSPQNKLIRVLDAFQIVLATTRSNPSSQRMVY